MIHSTSVFSNGAVHFGHFAVFSVQASFSNWLAILFTDCLLMPINCRKKNENVQKVGKMTDKDIKTIRQKMSNTIQNCFSPRATVPIRKGFPICLKSLLLWRPTSDPTANVTATWDANTHTYTQKSSVTCLERLVISRSELSWRKINNKLFVLQAAN